MIREPPAGFEPAGGYGEQAKEMNYLKTIWHDTAVSQSLLLFVVMRIFLSVWAVVPLALYPLPAEPNEEIRPYLGQPILADGLPGLLLGPWQRFDTNHYLRIAQHGYANEADSVFPPLYPLAIRMVGSLFGGTPIAQLTVALLISNLACLGLLILLHKVVTAELGPGYALRALVYLVLFPTGFFLFAAYTESLFILLALGSWWAARNGRFWLAGSLGFLASLTRLTGWILVIPLVYEWWKRAGRGERSKESRAKSKGISFTSHHSPFTIHHFFSLLPCALPAIALLLFFALRWWIGLPPIGQMYSTYWYQTTGIPGQDVITAVQTLFFGGAARANEIFALSLDFACLLLLIITTILAFRHLGVSYGLYAAMLLLFMLLPTSAFKPLYSFSRYTLAFFPTFMILAVAGKRPNLNRLILYPSVTLYLFFSGQFFIWGWVA